jgi:hypothetical protein
VALESLADPSFAKPKLNFPFEPTVDYVGSLPNSTSDVDQAFVDGVSRQDIEAA